MARATRTGAPTTGPDVDADLALPAVRRTRRGRTAGRTADDARLVLEQRMAACRGRHAGGDLVDTRTIDLEGDRGVGDVRGVDRRAVSPDAGDRLRLGAPAPCAVANATDDVCRHLVAPARRWD